MAVHRLRAAEIANLEESLGAAALDESGAAGGDAMTGCSGRFDWLLDFNEIKDCIVPAMRQSVADPETVVRAPNAESTALTQLAGARMRQLDTVAHVGAAWLYQGLQRRYRRTHHRVHEAAAPRDAMGSF